MNDPNDYFTDVKIMFVSLFMLAAVAGWLAVVR